MAGQPAMVSAGQHQAGTCRMGNDPQGSVVNKICQVHDVDNVFVIDSQRARHQRRIQSGAHHHGRRLLRVGCAGSQLERHEVPLMKRWLIFGAMAIASVALLAGLVRMEPVSTMLRGMEPACADCHEMSAHVSAIHSSPHRNVGCTDCHEASVATKLRHVKAHLMGAPSEIHLRDVDLAAHDGRTARSAISMNTPPGTRDRTAHL